MVAPMRKQAWSNQKCSKESRKNSPGFVGRFFGFLWTILLLAGPILSAAVAIPALMWIVVLAHAGAFSGAVVLQLATVHLVALVLFAARRLLRAPKLWLRLLAWTYLLSGVGGFAMLASRTLVGLLSEDPYTSWSGAPDLLTMQAALWVVYIAIAALLLRRSRTLPLVE